jgi:hypothetical protein
MVHPVVEKAFPRERFSSFINLILHLLLRTIYQFNYGVNPVVDETVMPEISKLRIEDE